MKLHIQPSLKSDCQTAMSLAWTGIVYTGSFNLRSHQPTNPGQEAST